MTGAKLTKVKTAFSVVFGQASNGAVSFKGEKYKDHMARITKAAERERLANATRAGDGERQVISKEANVVPAVDRIHLATFVLAAEESRYGTRMSTKVWRDMAIRITAADHGARSVDQGATCAVRQSRRGTAPWFKRSGVGEDESIVLQLVDPKEGKTKGGSGETFIIVFTTIKRPPPEWFHIDGVEALGEYEMISRANAMRVPGSEKPLYVSAVKKKLMGPSVVSALISAGYNNVRDIRSIEANRWHTLGVKRASLSACSTAASAILAVFPRFWDLSTELVHKDVSLQTSIKEFADFLGREFVGLAAETIANIRKSALVVAVPVGKRASMTGKLFRHSFISTMLDRSMEWEKVRARVRHSLKSQTTRVHYLRLVAPFMAVNKNMVKAGESVESWTRAAIPVRLSAPWCFVRTVFWSLFRNKPRLGFTVERPAKNILAKMVEYIGVTGDVGWPSTESRSLKEWAPFLFARVNVMVARSMLEQWSWTARE